MADPDVTNDRLPRVLVVEDEVMIRMLLEDMLAELGYVIASSAGRLEEALAFARDGDVDVAILDVNLNGDLVFPVAEVLAGRQVPFAFSTGYGDGGIPDAYRDRPILQKPFQMEGLEQTLLQLAPAREKPPAVT
jgi:CheY-like chemotaxis protein